MILDTELPTPDINSMFNDFFGKEMSRKDLKSIMLRSDAEFSTKRYNQFLEEMFGDEEHIETSKFLTKYRLLEESALEDIKSGKVEQKPSEVTAQLRIVRVIFCIKLKDDLILDNPSKI